MKLAAVLACRNQSARLYAKPLQNLDVNKGVSILDYLIGQLKQRTEIDAIVLAISEKEENLIYKNVAKRHGVPFVLGDDNDVLGRLIKGAKLVKADQILRVTTESPYTYFNNLPEIYRYHCGNKIDFSGTKGLPDGAFFEIISLAALEASWEAGKKQHRSELCSMYIFEHPEEFKIRIHDVPAKLARKDIRLTVDWPEDLIVMRAIYEGLKLSPAKPHSIAAIIEFLDKHPKLNAVNSWIDSGIGRIWD